MSGVLKDFDMSDGTNVVVQINPTYSGEQRVTLSLDGKNHSTQLVMSLEELELLKSIIALALKEAK
jgi:hypothetical protein